MLIYPATGGPNETVSLPHFSLKFLDEGLLADGRIRWSVYGCGGCAFRVASFNIYGSQVYYPMIRDACCDYILADPAPWEHLLFSPNGEKLSTEEYYAGELNSRMGGAGYFALSRVQNGARYSATHGHTVRGMHATVIIITRS